MEFCVGEGLGRTFCPFYAVCTRALEFRATNENLALISERLHKNCYVIVYCCGLPCHLVECEKSK
jgi:hypothetical protein